MGRLEGLEIGGTSRGAPSIRPAVAAPELREGIQLLASHFACIPAAVSERSGGILVGGKKASRKRVRIVSEV